MNGDLFNQKVVTKLCQDIRPTPDQEAAAEVWLELLEKASLEKERQSYPKFSDTLLCKILGFDPTRELVHEEDNVDYQFSHDGKKIVCFEAKGSTHKDLFARQSGYKREHATPIKQIWDYMGNNEFEYGVCTNFRDFILINRQYGYSKFYKFDFLSIKNDKEKLREFIGIFGKKSFKEGFSKRLAEESQNSDREFTKEFYKLFHETRLMLIKSFQENGKLSRDDAISYAQMFLNRMIFIFFVEDRQFINKKLFRDRVMGMLEAVRPTSDSTKIYDDIMYIFDKFQTGSKDLGIFGFNGSLFSTKIPENVCFYDLKDKYDYKDIWQHSKLIKEHKLNARGEAIRKRNPKLNPIILNMLIMDSFDFNTEVNVNILGHIFEQSIADIEELQKKGSTRRKIEGIYYTPEHITEHVCKSTILSHLSKTGTAVDAEDLVDEYKDDIESLVAKFCKITICDPACGSGAFLVKAVDVLLDIYRTIQERKESNGEYKGLEKWNEESEIRSIIENNIYGVDINKHSAEITKLAMFFKIAYTSKKLPDLSKNIRVGNSLISDKTVDPRYFDWKEGFPGIFNKKDSDGGFDIIVGNPPWQIVKPDIDEFFSPLYENMHPGEKFSRLTKNKKNRFMKDCLSDARIKSDHENYIRYYKKQMEYFKNSDKYIHQAGKIGKRSVSGDTNMYKLFVERSHSLLKSGGYCGLVVPSGIHSDLGSKGLRELLINENRLLHLFSFINRTGIFADVHRQFKFCVLVFEKSGTTRNFLASFYQTDISVLTNYKKIAYNCNMKMIKTASPTALTIPECKNRDEFSIIKKLYCHPLLGSNTWDFNASMEFHMTGDHKLFHTAKVGSPLYEGKMINMFTHVFAEPRYWIEEDEGIKRLVEKEQKRINKISKSHKIEPRIDYNEYRLAWRTITNATNERTLISTVLPPSVFLGHSLNYLNPIRFNGTEYSRPHSYQETVFLCGIFNSFVMDFVLRRKVSTNLTIFYMLELPIPRYDDANELHKKIVLNAARLICTDRGYTRLKKEIHADKPATNDSHRLGLEAQINAMVAKVYNLDKHDLKYILSEFPIADGKLKEETLNEFEML